MYLKQSHVAHNPKQSVMAHNPVHTVINRWFSIKRSELRFVNGWHVMLFSTRRIVKRGASPPGKTDKHLSSRCKNCAGLRGRQFIDNFAISS